MTKATSVYSSVFKPLLFNLEPEQAHALSIYIGKFAQFSLVQRMLRKLFTIENEKLRSQHFGLTFNSPIGLAAGFDKDCRAVPLLSCLGFGFLELGGVTAQPQSGNQKPRLFRLPEHSAIINRLGLPSCGADQAVSNLISGIAETSVPALPLALNLAKSHSATLESAIPDYLYTLEKLYNFIDIIVLNVSCPNEENYQSLQEKSRLSQILSAIQNANPGKKAFLVKLSPDLNGQSLDDTLECCVNAQVSGLICGNTTISRPGGYNYPLEKGGLSGPPLYPLALNMVRTIYNKVPRTIKIIGCGGISSSEQVLEMIKAGASLVQIYSALVYKGPALIKEMNLELIETIDRDGCKSVSDYIGTGTNQSAANS